MIPIASPDKQFDYGQKGSTEFAQEKVPEVNDLLPLVRSTVHNIMSESIGDEDDLFRAGANSLSALAIRNSIVNELRKSQDLRERFIETLPADLLYRLPSISKISVFLYGFSYIGSINRHMNASSDAHGKSGIDNMADAAPEVALSDEERWQRIQESKETVVEIARGDGETPLIVLHGAPGTVATFRPMLKSATAIWAVQMSDDAPAESVESLAAFYHQKIKEKQPHGPYRLASYSGSCALLLELVTTFEKNADEIIQFAILDHFPTLFLSPLDLNAVELDNPEWWIPVLRHSFEGIEGLLKTTEGPMAAQIKFHLQEIRDTLNGLPGTPFAVLFIGNMTKLTRITLEFLLGKRFTVEVEEGPNVGRRLFSPELFRLFTSKIKARLTIYAATRGIRSIVPPSKFDDLGAREFFPDVTVSVIEGGHLDFLGNDKLLKSLQRDY